MVLFPFFLKGTDLSKIGLRIIKNRFFLYTYYFISKYDCNWLEAKSHENLDSDILLTIINLSKFDNKYLVILEQIIEIIAPENISDEIFDKLFNYPIKSYKDKFLISLSHKSLSEKQLLALCHTECTFECFFELATLYYKDPKYSYEIFSDFIFMFKNCKYSELFDDLLEELLNSGNPSSKEKYIFLQNASEKKTGEKKTGDG